MYPIASILTSEFEEDVCKVTIIYKMEVEKIYCASTPNLVWERIFSEQGTKVAKLKHLLEECYLELKAL